MLREPAKNGKEDPHTLPSPVFLTEQPVANTTRARGPQKSGLQLQVKVGLAGSGRDCTPSFLPGGKDLAPTTLSYGGLSFSSTILTHIKHKLWILNIFNSQLNGTKYSDYWAPVTLTHPSLSSEAAGLSPLSGNIPCPRSPQDSSATPLSVSGNFTHVCSYCTCDTPNGSFSIPRCTRSQDRLPCKSGCWSKCLDEAWPMHPFMGRLYPLTGGSGSLAFPLSP